MTLHHSDPWLTIYGGDCRDVLRGLADESVHVVCTSPPYWGLRDYGTASWDGGDPACDHTAVRRPGPDDKSFSNGGTSRDKPSSTCRRCGATRQDRQLGLEESPEAYVAAMVGVFREVRRVLRDDGTLWLNLGDSYVANGSGQVPQTKSHIGSGHAGPNRNGQTGLKPKDLVGIPWRVAFALQADGWYLRSDIIWAKPNPMPESVTDRPTKAHEYLFLLTKSPRYHYDADAVREAWADEREGWSGDLRDRDTQRRRHDGTMRQDGGLTQKPATSGRNRRSVWTVATQPYGSMVRASEDGPLDTLSPDCPVHSLRAIRRTLRTASDDGLLDHLRSRSPRSAGRPAPEPDDALQPSFRLDSLTASGPATPGSARPGSSPEPTPASAPESRTTDRPTGDDAPASTARTELRTSHTSETATSPGDAEPSAPDAHVATGRNGHESRTSASSALPGSSAPSSAADTPGTGGPSGSVCSCIDNTMSHFAVMPEALVEPCVLAGCPDKACGECGAPWERVVEREVGTDGRKNLGDRERNRGGRTDGLTKLPDGYRVTTTTTGWRPTCAHADAPTVPGTVLDPFGGSGTVGRVANRLSRRAILIDLNPDYLGQQMARNRDMPLGLVS